MRNLLLPLVAIFTQVLFGDAANAQISCQVFDLQAELKAGVLSFTLKTDLPEDTVVNVGISRRYWLQGERKARSVEYLFETSAVTNWAESRSVPVGGEAWRKKISEVIARHQRRQPGAALDRADGRIKLEIRTPTNQPNKGFGEHNQNLKGKGVRTDGVWRGMFAVRRFSMDTSGKTEVVKAAKQVQPDAIRSGQVVVIANKITLLPFHDIGRPASRLRKAEPVAAGSVLVIERRFRLGAALWYLASHYGDGEEPLATGWVEAAQLGARALTIAGDSDPVRGHLSKSAHGLPAGFRPSYLRVDGTEKIQKSSGAKKVSAKILIARDLSRTELDRNLKHALWQLRDEHGADATAIRAYGEGDSTAGSYTAAKGVLAPKGNWGKAKGGTPTSELKTSISVRRGFGEGEADFNKGALVALAGAKGNEIRLSGLADSWGEDDIKARAPAGESRARYRGPKFQTRPPAPPSLPSQDATRRRGLGLQFRPRGMNVSRRRGRGSASSGAPPSSGHDSEECWSQPSMSPRLFFFDFFLRSSVSSSSSRSRWVLPSVIQALAGSPFK